jgi:hypothetical protein
VPLRLCSYLPFSRLPVRCTDVELGGVDSPAHRRVAGGDGVPLRAVAHSQGAHGMLSSSRPGESCSTSSKPGTTGSANSPALPAFLTSRPHRS